MNARRVLDAVTPRRIAVFLLIGGFAREIVSFLCWSAGIGRELGDAASLRALVAAAARFALEVALIYLAVRGLRWVLERRGRNRDVSAPEDRARQQQHRSHVPEHLDAPDGEWADRPWEGGGDGRGPDHH